MKKFISQGVFVVPGHAFNSDETQKCQNMRICYSYVTEDEIEKVKQFFSIIIIV